MISAAVFNICFAAVGAIFLFEISKARRNAQFFAAFFGALLAMAAFFSPLIFFPRDFFGVVQLWSWFLFLQIPLYLAGIWTVSILRNNIPKITGFACLFSAVALVAIWTYAYFFESGNMKITRITLYSGKIEKPVRVAVAADIQAADPGRYEKRVLEKMMQESPDIILVPGDILQIEEDEYPEKVAAMNRIFLETGLSAPFGIYAVEGNCDSGLPWQKAFSGVKNANFATSTESFQAGGITITVLSHSDSGNREMSVSEEPGYHIVLGHCPDFSLGNVNADLLVAGHTHGGQICIPFFGPIMTLSEVPREWASGLAELGGGRYLLVSRGIGMERGNAPALRFFCPPEVVIIDIVPK